MRQVSFGRYLLRQAVVLGFLTTTLSGFLYTVLRVRLPFVPAPLTYLSYSSMAPYQGTDSRNRALAAEGVRADGGTEEIDLARYYPTSRGRQDVRMLQVGWRRMALDESAPGDYLRRKYGALARRLLERERARGVNYTVVRLYWDEWPYSSGGHDALYESPQRTRVFYVESR